MCNIQSLSLRYACMLVFLRSYEKLVYECNWAIRYTYMYNVDEFIYVCFQVGVLPRGRLEHVYIYSQLRVSNLL
jgi:hypothetical protein